MKLTFVGFYSSVAQLVEQQTFNLLVPGSNPGRGTITSYIKQVKVESLFVETTVRDQGWYTNRPNLDLFDMGC